MEGEGRGGSTRGRLITMHCWLDSQYATPALPPHCPRISPTLPCLAACVQCEQLPLKVAEAVAAARADARMEINRLESLLGQASGWPAATWQSSWVHIQQLQQMDATRPKPTTSNFSAKHRCFPLEMHGFDIPPTVFVPPPYHNPAARARAGSAAAAVCGVAVSHCRGSHHDHHAGAGGPGMKMPFQALASRAACVAAVAGLGG